MLTQCLHTHLLGLVAAADRPAPERQRTPTLSTLDDISSHTKPAGWCDAVGVAVAQGAAAGAGHPAGGRGGGAAERLAPPRRRQVLPHRHHVRLPV